MTHLTSTSGPRFEPSGMTVYHLLQWGKREILICRDFRTRFYPVHPLIDCRPGMEAGCLEVLLFRKWLIILFGPR